MALLYFPKSSNLGLRNAWDSTYQELTIACNPNMVLYFDTASAITAASASLLYITASWAETASVTIFYASNSLSSSWAESSSRADSSKSSSYAVTSSFSLNAAAGGTGGGSSTASAVVYTTIVSSSGNWITASFLNSDQYITINSGAVYNFTCSNIPSANTASNLSLFINNIATVTCSLAFPSDWVFMGNTPLSLSSSRAAVLSLKNYGGTKMVAAFAVQY
jgi:hypothetical protein